MRMNNWLPVLVLPEEGQRILATLRLKNREVVTILNYESWMAKEGALVGWAPLPEPCRFKYEDLKQRVIGYKVRLAEGLWRK